MKVTILIGSVRPGRRSHQVAYYLKELLAEKKAVQSSIIDLTEFSLPLLGSITSYTSEQSENIRHISQCFAEADALLFVSPEYHGSFSGVIKNALDHFWGEFIKKPIGVVAVSSGKMGGINASTQLQHVILSLGAYPLPLKLLIPEVHISFSVTGEVSETVTVAANKFLGDFLWFADAIYAKKQSQSVA